MTATTTPILEATAYEAPPIGRCATPGCKAKAGHGLFRDFCKPCAATLARIRDEYEAERRNTCPSLANGLKKRQVRRSTCCTIGCGEPRRPGHAYCDVCEAMGVDEEAA